MQATTGPRTQAQASGSTIAGTSAVLGFLIAIVGSVGPWITDVVSSSGLQIQGKATAAVAVTGILFLLWGRQALKLAMLAAMGEVALGGYEYVHLHRIFGWALGWGVYAVIAGAVLASVGTAFSFAESAS